MFFEDSLNSTFDAVNGEDAADRSGIAIAFRVIIVLTDAILTIGGNLLGIVLLTRTRDIADGTQVYMILLSSSDFCIGLIALLSVAPVYLGRWPYGFAYCRVNVLIVSILCGVSILALVTVSLDRYIAVVWPLRYHSIMTKQKAVWVAVMIWIASITSNTVMWLYQSEIRYVDEAALCLAQWTDPNTVPMFVVLAFSVSNVPIVVISFIYCRIILISRHQALRIAATQITDSTPHAPANTAIQCSSEAWRHANGPRKVPPKSKRNIVRNGKAIRMFCVVAFGFAVAWLPYSILTALQPSDAKIPEWIEFIALWLLMSNSWWNVIIYLLMNKSIRESAAKLFGKVSIPHFRTVSTNDSVLNKFA